MNRDQFRQLFLSVLEEAVVIQESIQHRTLPRNFEIEFYGQGVSKKIIDPDRAFDLLYRGEAEFIHLVDIAAIAANSKITRLFVRVSAFPPKVTFEETWNYKEGTGPFKHIIAMDFRQLPE